MSKYPRVDIRIANFIEPTKLQQKLLDIINDNSVKRGINQIVGEYANNYVPMNTGSLRDSMEVDSEKISWGRGLKYARYQYNGEVFGPNIPIVKQGEIVGWFSRPGQEKQPTGRELGIPGEWRGWKFGYSTPGTKHHWIDEMLSNERRSMQMRITNYLKWEAKKKNQ